MSSGTAGNTAPWITVSILNYRRRDALCQVLESVVRQDYPRFDIIVVDNHSGEEDTSYIRKRFPTVQLIELPENRGTVARNLGIQAARGDIVVTLDNDVYLDGPLDLGRIASAFDRHPEAGCIAFRVCHPQIGGLHTNDWAHPRPWEQWEKKEFPTHYITEGAAAFRTEAFRKIEAYWGELFISHEGTDLAFRLLDAGYEIWYTPEVSVWHLASLETRAAGRRFYHDTRNLIPLVYRDLPAPAAVTFAVPRLARLAFYAVKYRCCGLYLRGAWDGLRCLPRLRGERHPVRRETLRKLAELREYQPNLFQRFARYWNQRP